MKFKSLLPLLAVFALGCSETRASFQEDAQDVWAQMRSYGAESSAAFQAQAEEQLDRFAVAVDELGDELAESKEAASEDLEALRGELGLRVDELRDELHDLGNASKETWSELRDRIVDALEELEDLVERHTSA